MCLGIPGRVIERLPSEAGDLHFSLVEFAGLRRRVCTACVAEAEPGDYVVVHAGFAISRLDVAEAERLLSHLRTMDETDEWSVSLGGKAAPS